jgi:hypothetical protein
MRKGGEVIARGPKHKESRNFSFLGRMGEMSPNEERRKRRRKYECDIAKS